MIKSSFIMECLKECLKSCLATPNTDSVNDNFLDTQFELINNGIAEVSYIGEK